MSRITVSELNERVNQLDDKMNQIIELLQNNSTVPAVKNRGSVKGSHQSKKADTKAASTMTVNVVDGKGRGEGKKFLAVTFDGKPSDGIRQALKGAGFRYFAPDKCWSIKYSKDAETLAHSLMK